MRAHIAARRGRPPVSPTTLAVLIIVLPFGAAVILAACPPLRRAGRPAAAVALVGSGLSLILAVRLATELWEAVRGVQALGVGPPREVMLTIGWLPQAGPRPLATVGVLVDPLAAAMAVLVALVAFLVQLYSLGYLAEEPPGA